VTTKLLLFFLLFILTGCSGSDDELLARIQQQMQPLSTMTSGYRVLSLDSLTNFEWDYVYFFDDNDGFETDQVISDDIGFKWDGPNVPNLYKRLLFVRQKEVVAYVDVDTQGYAGKLGLPIWMFGCPGGRKYGVAREEARFAIFRHCHETRITYYMAPLRCLDNFQDLLTEGCQDLPAQRAQLKQFQDSIQRAEALHNKEEQAKGNE
jgi:hypothetical protein